MEFFIKTIFWMGLFGVAIRAIGLFVFTYPRISKYKMEEDLASMVLNIFFIVWAYRLIWSIN
jgi:hypothetical protein